MLALGMKSTVARTEKFSSPVMVSGSSASKVPVVVMVALAAVKPAANAVRRPTKLKPVASLVSAPYVPAV